jgi:thymidine kinase
MQIAFCDPSFFLVTYCLLWCERVSTFSARLAVEVPRFQQEELFAVGGKSVFLAALRSDAIRLDKNDSKTRSGVANDLTKGICGATPIIKADASR